MKNKKTIWKQGMVLRQERADEITNEMMDKIRDYFWKALDMDLDEYFPTAVGIETICSDCDEKNLFKKEYTRSADDEIYSIIHNKIKQII